MDFLFILMGFAGLLTMIVAWSTYFRTDTLEDEISLLKQEVDWQKSQLFLLSQGDKVADKDAFSSIPQTSFIPQESINHPALPPEEDFDWEDQSNDYQAPPLRDNPLPFVEVEKSREEKSTFEFNIGAKLPVWIGAISLACAGFFLVKYSIEAGFFGPTTRFLMGLIFGLGMVSAGRMIANKPHIANSLRMAQGLVGAGLITLTFSLYSAVHFYDIITPFTGFCGMVAVVVATMVLALRLGQPVALFGMVGGFLAPALFSTHEPNFIALFGYLFVLYGGLQTIMFRQKWWGLSIACLIGTFIWSLLALVSPDFKESGTVLSVFVLAVSTMTLFSARSEFTPDKKDTGFELKTGPHLINLAAIAGSTLMLIFLQDRLHLGAFDWLMSGLLSLSVIGLAYLRPQTYTYVVWGKLTSDLILLALYLPHADTNSGILVSVGLLAVYGLIPNLIITKSHSDPKPWVITQVAGSILLYLTAYLRLPVANGMETDAYWGSLALTGSLYAAWQVKNWLDKGKDDVVAIYALATTSFLSIGLAIMLPMAYLPMAIAFEIAAILWIYQKLPIAFLQKIAFILLVVFAALNLPLLLEFIEIICTSIFSKSYNISTDLLSTTHILQSFFIPSLALIIAHTLYSRQVQQSDMMRHGLLGGTILLMTGGAYLMLRILFQDEVLKSIVPAGFIEREVVTLMFVIFAALIITYAQKADLSYILKWAHGLMIIAIIRNVYFDLLIYNPFFDGTQNVGSLPFLNGITLTYGSALVLVLYTKYKNKDHYTHSIFRGLALIFLFALTTLNVRQFFHGANLEQGNMTNSELYAYSIVWMLTGLGLLAYGIQRMDKNLRLAAMAFLTLTITKVFLIDASELQGLYRIFSFLGLGVSLIGLSMFYTRFMARNQKD